MIPRAALPRDVTAVLCGHVHRHQVLHADGLPPVIYAGSTERTSRAEAGETKGVVLLRLDADGLLRYEFRPLAGTAPPVARFAAGGGARSQVEAGNRAAWLADPPDVV